MIVDGKKLAEKVRDELRAEIAELGLKIRLAVMQVGSDPVTVNFLEQKKKYGENLGIDVRVYEFPVDISTNILRKKLAEIVHIEENTGVIVQLPLPKQINTQYILDGIVPEKDPDMLSSKSWGLFSSGRGKISPPVVGAVKYILDENKIEVGGKEAVVVGYGKLVGKPVAAWLINEGATVLIVNENTPDPKDHLLRADIIVSGVGKPHFITQDMVKKNVVAIDCGTSETSGQIKGDFDPAIEKKASIFSPVPGGVGPLTVAMLFKNLVILAK